MFCKFAYYACGKHLQWVVYGTLCLVLTGLYYIPVAALCLLAADGILYGIAWLIGSLFKTIHAGWKAAKPKSPRPAPQTPPPRPPTNAEKLAALRADLEEQKAMLVVLTRNEEERNEAEAQLERAFLIRAQKFLQ